MALPRATCLGKAREPRLAPHRRAQDEHGVEYRGFHAGGCPGIGSLMTNTNSLPREVTYEPLLRQLLYFPLPELAALRGAVAAQLGPQPLAAKPLALGAESLQSEVRASFALPSVAARLGVAVLAGRRADGSGFSIELYVDFVPNANGTDTWLVQAGYDSSSLSCPRYCRGCPRPGLDNRTVPPLPPPAPNTLYV